MTTRLKPRLKALARLGWSKSRRTRSRIMAATSRVGERYELDWLVYNPLVIAYYHEEALASAPVVADTFAAVFPDAESFVDVGAGTGAFAAELARRGRSVVALERSRVGRFIGRRQGVAMSTLDLERSAQRGFATADVAYCFEVAEHVRPELADFLVSLLANTAPIVVFTAAPPGQGGSGHVNEQPAEYWIAKFADNGMTHRPDLEARVSAGFATAHSPWLAANVHVFVR
jgi:SAM-dependent methyltransferase